ncbi:Major facilitator superfamily associated domain [Trinorchestia longiramus]|nr:Major facilitator superfamily associated domain [Trinorchestia longiramus]
MAGSQDSADMIVNKSVLIKLHYFLFFGGMAPILPFLLVLSLQLGASVMLMGTVGAMVLVPTILLKPFISTVADAFPAIRKMLFVGTVLLTCLTVVGIGFIPPFVPAPNFNQSWVLPESLLLHFSSYFNGSSLGVNRPLEYSANCSLGCAGEHMDCAWSWDQETSNGVIPWSDLAVILESEDSCELQSGRDCQFAGSSSLLQLKLLNSSHGYSTYTVFTPHEHRVHCSDLSSSGNLHCVAGAWSPTSCDGEPLQSHAFWSFSLLTTLASLAYTTANTFTDAITVDSLGSDGNYGSQRLWGTVGWGLMGPIGGLLVDWWSGPAITKDYTPAFFLVFVIMSADVVVASRLKVPALRPSGTVWSAVKPLVRRLHFHAFLFFTVINGTLCSVSFIYLFVLQEERAADTGTTDHIKLMQGLTVLVRAVATLPCMHVADRVNDRLGAPRFLSVVLFLHGLHMALTAAAGQWWPAWTMVLVELLSGPCFGFGYPAVVLYAKLLSPLGLSNTVQSLANVCYDTLGYALASVLSGFLITALGTVNMFVVWAVVSIVACLLHVLYSTCCSLEVLEGKSISEAVNVDFTIRISMIQKALELIRISRFLEVLLRT